MNWNDEHREFIVETFFKNKESIWTPDLNPRDFFLWEYFTKIFRPDLLRNWKVLFI